MAFIYANDDAHADRGAGFEVDFDVVARRDAASGVAAEGVGSDVAEDAVAVPVLAAQDVAAASRVVVQDAVEARAVAVRDVVAVQAAVVVGVSDVVSALSVAVAVSDVPAALWDAFVAVSGVFVPAPEEPADCAQVSSRADRAPGPDVRRCYVVPRAGKWLIAHCARMGRRAFPPGVSP